MVASSALSFAAGCDLGGDCGASETSGDPYPSPHTPLTDGDRTAARDPPRWACGVPSEPRPADWEAAADLIWRAQVETMACNEGSSSGLNYGEYGDLTVRRGPRERPRQRLPQRPRRRGRTQLATWGGQLRA
ncbi:hypothetical protein NDU88_005070 [Pleurodeles waltl]|uniref:Uncharacterized protein n=1 Tax=Pleurodeles waltl TaxID=8319 RepID=A0AAV7PJC4_PLEWA|nr:hypothetical protein NDU88_005070 [Pleurodeles waltl]